MFLCAFLPASCWLFSLKSYCIVGKYLSLLHCFGPIFSRFGLPKYGAVCLFVSSGFSFCRVLMYGALVGDECLLLRLYGSTSGWEFAVGLSWFCVLFGCSAESCDEVSLKVRSFEDANDCVIFSIHCGNYLVRACNKLALSANAMVKSCSCIASDFC